MTNPKGIGHNIDQRQCPPPPCINLVCGLTPAALGDHIWESVRVPAVPLYYVLCMN